MYRTLLEGVWLSEILEVYPMRTNTVLTPCFRKE